VPVPTGVAIRDAREQLFAAAERVLLRDGPGGLTSRSVTAEAGVAKGVLHRHFADFDAFLAELVLSRAERLRAQRDALVAAAGTGTVTGNVAAALTSVFESVAGAIVALVIFRDELRARLRPTWPAGVPLAGEAAAMLAAYLTAERDLGRVAAGADIPVLAPTLIGAAHLRYADRDGGPPPADEVRAMVAAVLAGVTGELRCRLTGRHGHPGDGRLVGAVAVRGEQGEPDEHVAQGRRRGQAQVHGAARIGGRRDRPQAPRGRPGPDLQIGAVCAA
jgi:AcrR family transcriptional regulator